MGPLLFLSRCSLAGQTVNVPRALKKINVAVIGNGLGPQHFIEHYAGQDMQNKGMGSGTNFTVVEFGKGKDVKKGSAAMSKVWTLVPGVTAADTMSVSSPPPCSK